MKEALTEWGFGAAWRMVRAMPQPMAAAIFRRAADRAARRKGPGVQRLQRNLACVLGEPPSEPMLRDAVRSYARYWLEAFRLPSQSPAAMREGFRLKDFKLLVKAHETGTGAVVALPHAGNWDAAGAFVTAHGVPLTTVAERLRPEGLYRRFLAYRERLGMRIVPLTGGAPPMELLMEAVKAAHVVPLLADRDLSARGVEVEFLGGRTRMPAGPAMLAIRTGAPLFVVNMWYEDVPCGEVIGPLPVPGAGGLDQRVRELTQSVADELGRGIEANPLDWHMLQKLWLTEPEPGSRRVA